jgi:hypothetical protein
MARLPLYHWVLGYISKARSWIRFQWTSRLGNESTLRCKILRIERSIERYGCDCCQCQHVCHVERYMWLLISFNIRRKFTICCIYQWAGQLLCLSTNRLFFFNEVICSISFTYAIFRSEKFALAIKLTKIPSQKVPFPVYPMSQVHVKFATEFAQVDSSWQNVPIQHSSSSINTTTQLNNLFLDSILTISDCIYLDKVNLN